MGGVALAVHTGKNLYLIRFDAIEKAIGEIGEACTTRFAASTGELVRILRKTLSKGVELIQKPRLYLRRVRIVPSQRLCEFPRGLGGQANTPQR